MGPDVYEDIRSFQIDVLADITLLPEGATLCEFLGSTPDPHSCLPLCDRYPVPLVTSLTWLNFNRYLLLRPILANTNGAANVTRSPGK